MRDMTQHRLNDLFEYDASAGVLIWRERPTEDFATVLAGKVWNSHYAGTAAGYIDADGYLKIRKDRKTWLAHRLIWVLVCGPIPAGLCIDHINGNKSDNCIGNLRIVSHAENHRNRSMPSDNTSGVLGVSWSKRACKWTAHIRIDGRSRSLGQFDNIDDAAAVRAKAERELGFHANHGRRPIAKAEGSSHA